MALEQQSMEYKGYRITSLGDFAMVKIQPKGSGDIPKDLEGHYTKASIAKQQIDNYLSRLVTNKKRTRKNDSEESTSSG